MSDQNDDDSEEVPPEIQSFLSGVLDMNVMTKSQMEHQHMHREEQINRINQFFRELSTDHLFTFHSMMVNIMLARDVSYASYLQGRADSLLIQQDICIDCGKNHMEEELLKSGETE